MKGTAPEFWGSKAAEYDGLIRRVVPGYEIMTERLLEALPAQPRSVLELGCGTGNLSVRLARAFPSTSLTLVDASAEMLSVVRARLATELPGTQERVRFVEATFEALAPEPGVYDAVVAGLSLHHVLDLGPVYATLATSLAPGGRFLSMDAVRAADAATHALHMERWHAFWRAPGNLMEEEIASVADHVARHDHYAPLHTHFAWLAGAGFTETDCLWRDGLFAVLAATRPGP